MYGVSSVFSDGMVLNRWFGSTEPVGEQMFTMALIGCCSWFFLGRTGDDEGDRTCNRYMICIVVPYLGHGNIFDRDKFSDGFLILIFSYFLGFYF